MFETNAKFFWDNFALFMRNWRKIRKDPELFNVKVGPIGLPLKFIYEEANLGSLIHAWKCPTIRVNCPCCQTQAYYVPANPDFLFCAECNKVIETPRLADYNEKFDALVNTWVIRSFREKSNLSLVDAVALLKQSDKEDLNDAPKPFSVNTTLQEFRELLWEDYPYDEEYMSREELVKLVSFYDTPDDQRLFTEAELAVEQMPGESLEKFSARSEAFSRSYKPELLSTEELKRRIRNYEYLNHWIV